MNLNDEGLFDLSPPALRAYLEGGGDVNMVLTHAPDFMLGGNFTLLHLACYRKDTTAIDTLLSNGARCDVRTTAKHAPYDVAMFQGVDAPTIITRLKEGKFGRLVPVAAIPGAAIPPATPSLPTLLTTHSSSSTSSSTISPGSNSTTPRASPNSSSSSNPSLAVEAKRYAAFISHHQAGAGDCPRLIKVYLENELGPSSVCLDRDDVDSLGELRDKIKQSKAVVLLLTREVLTRPWVITELYQAYLSRIPVIPVYLWDKGYVVEEANRFLTNLDTELERRTPMASATLRTEFPHDSLTDIAYALSTTIPFILSWTFDAGENKYTLEGTIHGIVDAIKRAKFMKPRVSREEWDRVRASGGDASYY